jgi:hypothetical protein
MVPKRYWWMLSVVFVLLSVMPLVRHFTERTDIWWTPLPLAVPLAETADRVEVYVRGRILEEHLHAGTLTLTGVPGPARVAAADITFRFNNRDRRTAQQLLSLLASAAVGGAVLALGFSMLARRRAGAA